MLSTEIPPVLPDPSKISELKKRDCDEKAFDNNLYQLKDKEVDLLDESGLDDINLNPVSNFCMRDYVFNTRSKDIKINWPFSHKSLQLCLKHGVKDVLPPFQSLDSVKNPSVVKYSVENISSNILPISSSNVVQELALDIKKNINSSGFKEDKESSQLTKRQSCSEINSLLPIKSTFLEAEAENLPESFLEKPELAVPFSNKASEQKSNEDLTEKMASKVCPVCKTFSSSSNTTLNAHIDQCLSGEPTAKWTVNSKAIKHRIKPRKTRLMVDIYSTALYCTLEDLDRRNGTSWASNTGFPAEDLEVCAEKNKEKDNCLNIVDKNEEGDVYIDSSGTKVRILSKFSDPPNAKYDCGPQKLIKKDKGIKDISTKRKNYLAQKHMLSKCTSREQRSSSSRPGHFPEVTNGKQREFLPEEASENEDQTQHLKTYDQMKSDDLGTIKKWVGSKRSGLKKKMNHEDRNEHQDGTMKNLSANKSLSSLDEFSVIKTVDSNPPNLCDENPVLHKRREIFLCNSRNECDEEPCVRETVDLHGTKTHLLFSKRFFKKFRKDGHLVRGYSMDSQNGTDNNYVSSTGNMKIRKNIDPSPRKTFLNHGISPVGKNFSSFKKSFKSVKHASVLESKNNMGKKHLNFKRRKLRYMSESDEEAVIPYYAKKAAQIEKNSGESRVLRNRNKKGGEEMTLNVSIGTSDVMDFTKEVETREEFVDKPISKVADEEAFITFSRPLDSPFPALSGSAELIVHGENFVDHDTRVVANEGGNYFVDDDLIPIPGPPGSFLPNPGHMGSDEEIHGNSSLTTCRVQSSDDEREFLEMDSLESSNISNTSMVSNVVAARSDSVSFVNNSPVAKFLIAGDCESPSTSNSVFRLMGKNFVVMNKDENPSPQTQNDYHSFHHNLSRAPSIFEIWQKGMPGQHFVYGSSDGHIIPDSSLTPQFLPHPMVSSKSFGGVFMPFDQLGPKMGTDSCMGLFPQLKPVEYSGGNEHKEIIVIDDSPEGELGLVNNMEVGGSFVGKSGSGYDSRSVNPFYNYQTIGYPLSGESRMVQNANTKMPRSMSMSSNIVKLNCNPDGSRILYSKSSTGSTPSTGHERSSQYYSPGIL